ncbi:hypothetical protein N473_16555 [Pseudoalteromonas luteoviolacea CPMOR-1]|uniref:Outer membrane protein beta-barrel domain-containing protein n=1 Tax=Pseudoalteromonas luteoviolacea CPMOR-1 TaxID=1365248 RepID=A0A167L3W8_9GAMM|nr:outer membrane beta-barrel protein [Pseudoalteromonas luteoviolacea]KZN63766.1 hypothetical protein N473_16555 [Pseudoalteromonas luteoviolacea CPMOR-1]
MKQAILAVGLLTSMSSFATEETQNNVTYSLTAGYTFGGDTILHVTYTNDDTQNIKAGQGLIVGGGLSYKLNNKWAIEASANYHSDTAFSKDGDLSFERLSFNVVPYYRANQSFSIGVGIGLQTGVELSNDFGGDLGFENETAYIGSLKYHFETLSADLELRHTLVEYTMDYTWYKLIFNGNNTGLVFHWKF